MIGGEVRKVGLSPLRWLVRAGFSTLLVGIVSCTHPVVTSSVAIPPISAGQARIWFYRDNDPYAGKGLPAIAANGRYVGAAELGATFYRNLPPGHYYVTVESYGEDFSQTAEVDLAIGKEAFVKIVSLPSWVNGGIAPYERPTFYAWLIPSEVARDQIANLAFYGGG